MRATLITVLGLVVACGGKLDGAETTVENPRPEGPRRTPEREPRPDEPVPAPEPRPADDTWQCTPFDIHELGKGVLGVAERTAGSGFVILRFDDETTGTVDYLPDASGGPIFCAAAATGTMRLEPGTRELTFTFPAPCGVFRLAIERESCRLPTMPPGIELRTAFVLTDEAGRMFTESVLARFPASACDPSFSTCTWVR